MPKNNKDAMSRIYMNEYTNYIGFHVVITSRRAKVAQCRGKHIFVFNYTLDPTKDFNKEKSMKYN